MLYFRVSSISKKYKATKKYTNSNINIIIIQVVEYSILYAVRVQLFSYRVQKAILYSRQICLHFVYIIPTICRQIRLQNTFVHLYHVHNLSTSCRQHRLQQHSKHSHASYLITYNNITITVI